MKPLDRDACCRLRKLNVLMHFLFAATTCSYSYRSEVQNTRMMATSAEVTPDTLSMLEARLKRIDYVLNGYDYQTERPPAAKTTGSAAIKLRGLERSLQSLAASSSTITDILNLRKAHPEIFDPDTSSPTPATLPPQSLASLILAHKSLYATASNNLTQLQDFSVADPSTAAKLTNLQPRIDEAQAKQRAQAVEFAELRDRSARAVEAWYEGGVLRMDGQWAEWEERLRDAEILVRRREAAKRREDGAV